jgi:hypothetical protein
MEPPAVQFNFAYGFDKSNAGVIMGALSESNSDMCGDQALQWCKNQNIVDARFFQWGKHPISSPYISGLWLPSDEPLLNPHCNSWPNGSNRPFSKGPTFKNEKPPH